MKRILILVGVILLACSLAYFALYIFGSVRHSYLYGKQEKKLAELFGINLVEYKRNNSFPYQYFVDNLEKGMSVHEVHQVMRGYEKVLKCGEATEVYYYYYKDDGLAYRYQIIYDEGKYFGNGYGDFRIHEGTRGDDYLLGYENGCMDGLLAE